MEWTDEAVVLGVKRHGEANAILEVMTRGHGRYLGLVRGGAGSRLRPLLQPGNSLLVTWRARLEEHLGHFIQEATRLRTAEMLASSHAVYAVTYLASLTRLLPERDSHERIFHGLEAIFDRLDDPFFTASLIVRFELEILSDLGFGLDLSRCTVTGAGTDLVYVSPKSGRAVSAAAGEIWRDRLLPLPDFLLRDAEVRPSTHELMHGFALTYFFLCRHVFEPRGIVVSDARQNFIAAVGRIMPDAA